MITAVARFLRGLVLRFRAVMFFYRWRSETMKANGELTHAVVLVPGLMEPARLMRNIDKRLKEAGFATYIFHVGLQTLLPYMVIRWRAIRTIRHIRQSFPQLQRLDLVAHSLGGLLAMDVIRSGACDGLRIRLVTLGTAHRGTWMAVLGMWSLSAYQLFPFHPRYWFNGASRCAQNVTHLSIAGTSDWLAPKERCNSPHAKNVLAHTGHSGLLTDSGVQAAILVFLKDPQPSPPVGG